jgi:hypothetical protein
MRPLCFCPSAAHCLSKQSVQQIASCPDNGCIFLSSHQRDRRFIWASPTNFCRLRMLGLTCGLRVFSRCIIICSGLLGGVIISTWTSPRRLRARHVKSVRAVEKMRRQCLGSSAGSHSNSFTYKTNDDKKVNKKKNQQSAVCIRRWTDLPTFSQKVLGSILASTKMLNLSD